MEASKNLPGLKFNNSCFIYIYIYIYIYDDDDDDHSREKLRLLEEGGLLMIHFSWSSSDGCICYTSWQVRDFGPPARKVPWTAPFEGGAGEGRQRWRELFLAGQVGAGGFSRCQGPSTLWAPPSVAGPTAGTQHASAPGPSLNSPFTLALPERMAAPSSELSSVNYKV